MIDLIQFHPLRKFFAFILKQLEFGYSGPELAAGREALLVNINLGRILEAAQEYLLPEWIPAFMNLVQNGGIPDIAALNYPRPSNFTRELAISPDISEPLILADCRGHKPGQIAEMLNTKRDLLGATANKVSNYLYFNWFVRTDPEWKPGQQARLANYLMQAGKYNPFLFEASRYLLGKVPDYECYERFGYKFEMSKVQDRLERTIAFSTGRLLDATKVGDYDAMASYSKVITTCTNTMDKLNLQSKRETLADKHEPAFLSGIKAPKTKTETDDGKKK